MTRPLFKPLLSRRMWMVRGPDGFAPFYGVAFTRRELLTKLTQEASEWERPLLRVIRVTVYPAVRGVP